MYRFSQSSLKNLEQVHPDLVKLCHRTLEITPYDFGIIEGLRTIERQKSLVESNDSNTMDSNHLMQDSGYAHAIDFAVWVNGSVTWEIGYYRKVIQAFFTAAIEQGVQINSGGLWRTIVDGPHIELNRSYYG